MVLSLNSNIAALQATRRLSDSSRSLDQVFQRLASGQRINSASDDAAGLAIASALNTDRRVFSQGIRNMNDGVSLLNIADSTLGELSGIVIRIQELAEQAANGTFSRQQRESLDQEAQALRAEFLRISQSAKFNGLNIFDGSLQGLRLQGGYGVDGSIFSSLGGKLASGTFGSSSAFTSPGGHDSEHIAIADLNGDGAKDMVYTGNLSLVVALGNGDGTFQEASEIVLTSQPTSVQLGDFNNDGVVDITIANDVDNTVELFIGNGDGTFQASQSFALGGVSPADITLDDVNRDGALDVVAVGAGALSILLGTGSGSFEAARSYQTYANSTASVKVGDINGDGELDIVSASDTGGSAALLTILAGNGDGTFQTRVSVATGIDATNTSLDLADLNGDGALDIVLAGGDHFSILVNDGDGSFGTPTTVRETDQPFTIDELQLRDVNGDGFHDLIWAGRSGVSARAVVRLGDGSGSFGDATVLSGGISTQSGLAIGDFDGDGVEDLVVGGASGATIFDGGTKDGLNPLLAFSLETQSDALQALAPLERKLSQLAEQRGVIGAFQSRLSSAISVLGSATENSAAAESRIRDADIAFETSNLTRLSILQRAAAAVLSQANLQPALAIQLLGE